MIKLSKDDIRKALLRKRKELSERDQQLKSQQIVHHISQSDIFKQAGKVALYYAVRGEADPSSLMDNHNKQFYLPILSSNKNQGLVFAPINKNTQYENNTFSIPEPIVEPDEFIDAMTLDLVIMPLLGFDSTGNRLGMGGGYYDRCFAFKKKQTTLPILMGFAYDFQEVDTLDAELWDIGLDIIATESQLRTLYID